MLQYADFLICTPRPIPLERLNQKLLIEPDMKVACREIRTTQTILFRNSSRSETIEMKMLLILKLISVKYDVDIYEGYVSVAVFSNTMFKL